LHHQARADGRHRRGRRDRRRSRCGGRNADRRLSPYAHRTARTHVDRPDDAEIARIVARAHDLDPRERLAYLRASCANDSDACDRALKAHSLTQSDPAPEGPESGWAIDRSGQVLGPWRLLRRLGGGGMSDVYLAERIGEYRH